MLKMGEAHFAAFSHDFAGKLALFATFDDFLGVFLTSAFTPTCWRLSLTLTSLTGQSDAAKVLTSPANPTSNTDSTQVAAGTSTYRP